MQSKIATIEEIITEARLGRMFILIDDEQRENEGDLVIPADAANAEAINFMALHGRGLICLSLTHERVEQLKLPLMANNNKSRHQTAFTVSIEAREGISTGISAHDRARTVAVAIDADKTTADIVSPGHIFPLVARDGGVLVRAGHTEAAVDIARLAGRNPSGVICEIMKDDGTMARLPDLLEFAAKHNLKIGTIADLISYRRRTEKLVTRTAECKFHSRFGGNFTLHTYSSQIDPVEHIALVKGDIAAGQPVLVRMHALRILQDVLGDDHDGKGGEIQKCLEIIGREGGVLVLLRDHQRPQLSQELLQRLDNGSKSAGGGLRDYGIGAQILLDLGVRDMILLSNSKPQAIALDGYGLNITGHRQIG